jgi:hypothetical protein
MRPATLERALHKWPLWDETILEARTELNFKPAVLEAEEQTKSWEKDIGWDKAVEVCLEAMSKMGLPWYFGFYWLACFCADYRSGRSVDYSRIKVPPQNVSQAWGQQVRERFVKNKGIVMLYLEDKTYDEIGEIIGLKTSNVSTKISRIKEKMKLQILKQI